MADLKISALTASTVPLAGTEVLPIVQSGTTKQVSVDNLTTGKTVPVGVLSVTGAVPRITADMSNATQASRLMFQTTTANSATSVGAIPSGSGTSSRFNLFNSSDPDNAGYLQTQISSTNAIFNSAKLGTGTALPYLWQIASVTQMDLSTAGNLTLGLGNLVIGTSGKGIDFSATPGTGTSELLADYEEGTFTPTYDSSGATFSYTEQYGAYTKVGNQVTFTIRIKAQSSGTSTNALTMAGLPFTSASGGSLNFSSCAVNSQTGVSAGAVAFTNPSSTTISIRSAPGVDATPAFFSLNAAALWVVVSGAYFV